MPFLPRSQQSQSTEGTAVNIEFNPNCSPGWMWISRMLTTCRVWPGSVPQNGTVSFCWLCRCVSCMCCLLQPVSVVVDKTSFPHIHRPLRFSPSDPRSTQIFGCAFADAIFWSLVITGNVWRSYWCCRSLVATSFLHLFCWSEAFIKDRRMYNLQLYLT